LVYRIEFDADALKELKKLDRPVQQRWAEFLKTRVGRLDNRRELDR
jgi:mRNA interferase RelE/StbE